MFDKLKDKQKPLRGKRIKNKDKDDAAKPDADVSLVPDAAPQAAEMEDDDPLASLPGYRSAEEPEEDPFASLPGFGGPRGDEDEDDGMASLPGGRTVEAWEDEPAKPAESQLSEDEILRINMDKQIEEMLAADAAADLDFRKATPDRYQTEKSVEDTGDEFGKTLSWVTYGMNAPPPPAPSDGKRKKKLKDHLEEISLARLMVFAIVFVAVITGLGYVSVVVARAAIQQRQDQEAVAHFTPILQPEAAANNANFIFINESVTLGGRKLTLGKMSAGRTATLFYFNESFDPDDYIIMLTDQNSTLFHRYQSDSLYDTRSGTVLRFDRVNNNTLFLTLYFQHIPSGEEASFYYRYEHPAAFAAPVYISRPIAPADGENAEIRLESAVVGNTGTEIIFSLRPSEDPSELRVKDDAGMYTELYESINRVSPMTRQTREYDFNRDGTIMGRMFFSSVRNLRSPLTFTFKDLIRIYDGALVQPDTSLLLAREEGGQTFALGENILVLEGMGIQRTYVFLVLHSTDASGKRKKTDVEADLIVETKSGSLRIPGTCTSSRVGSDVVFDLTDYQPMIPNITTAQYTLDIKSVQYDIPPLTLRMEPPMFTNAPNERLQNAETFVREAFLSRLAYKSNAVTLDEVTGFSPEMLSDRVMMRRYSPVSAPARYTAQVVGGMLLQDGAYAAVVEDEWISGEGADRMRLAAVHEVVMERRYGAWIIVSDVIVKG